MQYTIQAVATETRSFKGKFGDMTSYKIKLEGVDTPVELVQMTHKKDGTPNPGPEAGQQLNGTIDTTGQYGPKFKKEFSEGGGFGNQSAGRASSGGASKPFAGRDFDPFTMYLSYAKDVAVALIGSKAGFDQEVFGDILKEVIAGGKTLYNNRPGGEPTEVANKPEDDEFNAGLTEAEKIFGPSKRDDKVIDPDDIPFN